MDQKLTKEYKSWLFMRFRLLEGQTFCLFRSTLHPEYKIASLESILSLKVYENKRVYILNIRVNSWLNS
ncbi:MAG: hypothetical protein IEMM0008_0407 [bacterium]|nr:MAG: hypothetical protein IEMM0008_0407 [bacterium]